jgi:hypothetical protein
MAQPIHELNELLSQAIIDTHVSRSRADVISGTLITSNTFRFCTIELTHSLGIPLESKFLV